MKVLIPTPLRNYTKKQREVDAAGATMAELLADLDRQFPGIRFRMIDEQGKLRPHIAMFVGTKAVRDLSTPISPDTELMIVAALSGG